MKKQFKYFGFLLFLISCNADIGTSEHQRMVDSDFNSFFKQFTADSAFQLEHTKFPLEGTYNSYDGQVKWSKSKWQYMDFELEEVINNIDDSVSVIENDTLYFLGTYCKECGFSFEMKFEAIENEWMLVYRQENNF